MKLRFREIQYLDLQWTLAQSKTVSQDFIHSPLFDLCSWQWHFKIRSDKLMIREQIEQHGDGTLKL
jgi:hypothetical protein